MSGSGKELALKLICQFAGALLLVSICAGQDVAPGAPDSPAPAASLVAPGSIADTLEALGPDAQEFDTHITTLADPFFEGRAPGSRGNALAAEYVEFHFRQLGLTPLFPQSEIAADGAEVLTPRASYRQTLDDLGSAMGPPEEQRLVIEAGGAPARALRHGTDFVTLGYAGDGKARAGVTFVGYSIAHGQDGYTSYPEGTDLTGRIALVLRYEPMDDEGLSHWAARGWSVSASLAAKIGAALHYGAEGVILVNAPGADDPRADRLIDPGSHRADTTFDEPVVMMTIEQADALVRAGDPEGRSLLELRKLADEGMPPLALEGGTVELQTVVRTIASDNVGAALSGRGALADEWLIIGAHYDHVGYGAFGSLASEGGRVHPGADDNASGTAGLLLAARLLREAYDELPPDADARSIAFVAFTAEESGMIGSEHFVAHPPMPRDAMYLMFNMDMIGRLRDRELEIEGAATGEGLKDWARPYFDRSGLVIALAPRVLSNSDHASFYQADIPILCFFSGYHDQYHRPTDVAALINRRGAVQIVRLVVDLALGLAQREGALPFRKADGQREIIAADPLPDVPPAPKITISLGVTTSESDTGLRITDVEPDSPAAAGGLQEGDTLLRWNRQEVADLAAWQTLLVTHSPGDLVEVLVDRDGKQVTGYVILGRK